MRKTVIALNIFGIVLMFLLCSCTKSTSDDITAGLVYDETDNTWFSEDEDLKPLVNILKRECSKSPEIKGSYILATDDRIIFIGGINSTDVNGNKVAIYCITGQGRLHDRFVLTEGEGWQIGSSLSEFGKRACCIIKLFDSACMELDNLLCGWCNDGNVSYKIE